MEFSEDIVQLLKDRFPDKDIYKMSLQELKAFRILVDDLRHEYSLLELANKLLGNGAYGSCASDKFYFFNVALASDITAECRNLTQTMWNKLEEFFHKTIWERKDLWEKFDFALDESKHEWYNEQPISVYSDTDSVYTTYGTLFECFTDEYKKKYDTDDKRLAWILKFNKDFIDKQNNQWCEEMYNPRHGNSIHEFELETVSKACIYLKKKKYLKGLIFSKGKYFDHPKMMGAGIEIVKSTTPKLCRDILLDMTKSLMFESGNYSKTEYFMYFQSKLEQWRRKFYTAPIEDISQSVGIGDYKKFVIEDENDLILEKGCPVSVKGIARYNYLAFKNDEKWKRTYSGKIKYYNISLGPNNSTFFGYPAGELPEWAPKMDKTIQWKKTVIEPINRFIEVMGAEGYNPDNTYQLSLF